MEEWILCPFCSCKTRVKIREVILLSRQLGQHRFWRQKKSRRWFDLYDQGHQRPCSDRVENLTFPLYRPSFLFYLVCTPCTPMFTTIMQFTFLCLAYTNVHLMKKLKYVDDIQQTMIFVWNIIGVIVGLGICMIIEYRNIKKTSSLKIK